MSVVNIFASWCGPCHEENPQLVAFSQDKRRAAESVKLVGIAYKDLPENTRRYLGQEGNPYSAIGVDASGRTGIDFGVLWRARNLYRQGRWHDRVQIRWPDRRRHIAQHDLAAD